MIEYKLVLGIISIIIAAISYFYYISDIFKGKTKPHAYSWLIWSVIVGIGFFSQYLYGGGSGSWVLGFGALMSLAIFFLALSKGEKDITISDKFSFVSAGIAILLWQNTNNPVSTIILLIIIEIFAFYPTFRKSYYKPGEETLITYFLGGSQFLIALFALQAYSVETYLYTSVLVLLNYGFVIFVIIRKGNFLTKTL
jgi:hypothetical protein